jgi:hypothetical protein
MTQQVKVIGANGQVSLGKEFAGKMILIDQIDNGTWIIKAGEFIPDSEKWLYQSGSSLGKLDKAIEWAHKHEPKNNFDDLAKKLLKKQKK